MLLRSYETSSCFCTVTCYSAVALVSTFSTLFLSISPVLMYVILFSPMVIRVKEEGGTLVATGSVGVVSAFLSCSKHGCNCSADPKPSGHTGRVPTMLPCVLSIGL